MDIKDTKTYKTIIYTSFISLITLWLYTLLMHNVFEEWDGVMHYFSGVNFWETGAYKGWGSYFWPPLQPLIISLGNPLIIGKLVAFSSGVLILITTYYFLDNFQIKKEEKLTVLVLLFSSSFFISNFSVVENHAIESLFYISGLHIFILSEKNNSTKLLIFSAILIALAGLSRYTSYTLALVLGLYLLLKFNKNNIIKFIIFSSVFCIVSLSWWIPNFIMNGSPLFTWQYLNIGSRIHPDGRFEWWWINQENYNNLSNLITAHPKETILNLIDNYRKGIKSILRSLTSNDYTSSLFFLITALFGLKSKKISSIFKDNSIEITAILVFLLLCSTAFIFKEALLPITILSLILISTSFINLTRNKKLSPLFILFIIISNVFITYKESLHYIEYQKDRGGQLSDLVEVTKKIKEEKSTDSRVVSVHPARAYYAETKWIMFPLAGADSICNIVDYSYSEKIRNYAPKHPVNDNKNINVNFIVITKNLEKRFKFISSDLKIDTKTCGNKNLNSIYKTADTNIIMVTKNNVDKI